MSTEFKDLAEVFDPDLYLPIRGKTYRVPAPDAETGLRLFGLFRLGVAASFAAEAGLQASLPPEELAKLKPEGDDETAYLRDNLGSAYEEMQADKVPLEYVHHAANTAFMRWTVGPEAAAAFWVQAGPEVGAGKAAAGRLRTQTRAGTAVESTPTASPTGTTSRARSTTARKPKGKGKARR